jgi:hypothetical protein
MMSNRKKLGIANTPEMTRTQFENMVNTALGIKRDEAEIDITLYYRKDQPVWRAMIYKKGYAHALKNLWFDFLCRANLNEPEEPQFAYNCFCEACDSQCMNTADAEDTPCAMCKIGNHMGVENPDAEKVVVV